MTATLPHNCVDNGPLNLNAYADKEAAKNGPEATKAIKQEADRLRKIAVEYATQPLVHSGSSKDYSFFTVEGRLQHVISTSTDRSHNTRNKFHIHSFHVQASNTQMQAPCSAWAIVSLLSASLFQNSRISSSVQCHIPRQRRLVDMNARAILQKPQQLFTRLETTGSRWLNSMAAGYNNPPPPPNILLMLFTKEPFNYAIIHGLVFLVLFLCWRATWLGRRQSQRQQIAEQFQQHVDALARHLTRQRHKQQYQAIAHAIGKETGNENPHGDAESIALLNQIYQQEDTEKR